MPQRFWDRLRRPRNLSLTREGKYFIAITIGIGLAAINTGNNLLYLLLGWLLSLIIASGILSDICLRGIRITRVLPKHIFANQPFVMELEAHNQKKRYASYSIELEDMCQGHAIDKRSTFLKIPANVTQCTSYRHTISKRGLYLFDGFRISTKFPFGLFKKSRTEDTSDEVLVFPAVRPLSLPRSQSRTHGENKSKRIGRHGEFFGLREYREGDDRRSIHWRSSARDGRLLVREYEDESQKQISLFIDNALPFPATEIQKQHLEDAIGLCASLCKAYLQRGYSLRLIGRGMHLPFAAGNMQLYRAMRTLALLDTVAQDIAFSAQPVHHSEAFLLAPKDVMLVNRPVIPYYAVEPQL